MIKFSGDTNYFNIDEQSVLNHLAVDQSKEEFLDQLSISRDLTSDEDILSLLDDVQDKVESLSVEEWQDLQLYLPFDIPVYDEIDEVNL